MTTVPSDDLAVKNQAEEPWASFTFTNHKVGSTIVIGISVAMAFFILSTGQNIVRVAFPLMAILLSIKSLQNSGKTAFSFYPSFMSYMLGTGKYRHIPYEDIHDVAVDKRKAILRVRGAKGKLDTVRLFFSHLPRNSREEAYQAFQKAMADNDVPRA